ncbi:flavodoxin [Paenibacillus polysaccharolyticus]|uniref:Flavodoxin n=1 Tax=Paenibacillus cucumis (ex Kampfer et al. 2016) TaxID=1776858 RepID=A0ABS7KH38_9BACL|nr:MULTISPECIES: flavodoxin [Paenibacillus]MBY0203445.1 flavodoxin [Paenibacillus cucumis (ex Kampfer et al. 2016)]MCM3133193.1 flavodoxin [Paenibacillus polysaccharolyticus]MCP1133175.1 flavodoxin [Paenibacillus polysaccharolyticus]MDP9697236.1 flavodoxin I [Paenibacillus intestini]
MAKWLVAYASMTGNTEEIAELIVEGITASGHEADLKSVTDFNAAEVLNYEGFMIGVYTWGDGELPDEFLDFYEELDELDLHGKRAAVFGSGDTSYEQFCGAVDLTAEKLKERGAEVSPEMLKIEYSPLEQEKESCRDFGRRFVTAGAEIS